MAKSLVIVESPAKANTIKKYLGKDFQVTASVGHVKDLPEKSLGVDVDKDFKPEYQVIKGKKKILSDITKLAEKADTVYLGPDPDREGEAIAWHIWEDIKKKKNKHIYRVLFNEITKKGIQEAIKHPQSLDKDKYHAQQARRILDRLVGYKISPILWNKVRRGLSAGRVQSVALRMIVEREAEIKAFKSEEYWSIIATLIADQQTFQSRLAKIDDQKPEVNNESEARAIVEAVKDAHFTVQEVVRKERRKYPIPPFITSKLQQDGVRKLGFTAKKTMMLAQKLYEGIELGAEGPHGLITYMRTDSTRLANEAVEGVRDYIGKKYGKDYLPEKPNVYQSRKSAQEAHEAIRPTSLQWTPSQVKPYLDRDLFRLYELIWNRFVACQMTPAVLDQTTINFDVEGPRAPKGKYLFRSNGQVMKFPGFLAVYAEEKEETQRKKGDVEEVDDHDNALPPLNENDSAKLKEVTPNQHFTEPPPRYSEASLVKAMEENGIGRPSTYASIITAIVNREYVVKNEKTFCPSDLGILVTDLLVKSFPNVLNVEFTAGMEEKLDSVEEGKRDWVQMLKEFYQPFKERLDKAQKEMRNVKQEETPTEHVCEKCGAGMVIKWGRRGKFLACSSYPDCKNTKEFREGPEGKIEIQKAPTTDETCEKCGAAMVVKTGRFGRFLACSSYPECKSTKSFTIGIKCSQKDCAGDIVEKRSRRGKLFYGCSAYPKCSFATWFQPIQKACPDCKAPFLVKKASKKEGVVEACLSCAYQKSAE